MTRYRQTPTCPYCDKATAKAIYAKKQSWQPPFAGDTFIRWENISHKCTKDYELDPKETEEAIIRMKQINLKQIKKSDKIIYIDMDGVMADFDKAAKAKKEKHPKIMYPQSLYGFFYNLEPIEGAIETINWLRENFDVYILTAPSVKNPLCYTEKRNWIEKHFDLDFVRRLIISPHKNLSIGDYLIDDNIKGKGQDKFKGELIHFASEKYPNWKNVKEYFETKLK